MTGALDGFQAHLEGQRNLCKTLGQALAVRLKVPYLKDCESERLLGHRLQEMSREDAIYEGLLPTRRFRLSSGEILETNEWPADLFTDPGVQQLTDEVWTRDYYPDSVNDIQEAMEKLKDGVTAIYFHNSQLCLILVAADGKRVGIRSTAVSFGGGLNVAGIKLLGNLRAAPPPKETTNEPEHP